MVNRWIDDAWSGPNGAHAQLLAAGLGDVCAFVPAIGARVEGCMAYFDTDVLKAAQLGVELTKDQAIVRLLFKTNDGVTIATAPRNGDTIEFEDRSVTVASRLHSDDDGWFLQCKV